MSSQSKTFLKFVASIILIAFILDIMLRNVILSSGVAFLISVTFFYSPDRLIAKKEEEGKNKDVSTRSTSINSNKKKKKTK
ncbi:hypothetical protein K5V21_13575 [Clostridium sardiniense]|uniref:Uncharacterized protein n=1 Tax=Clostridium sardiniense TaxID=29369 RepID=A0ABS7L091_CLOSR|nr:hypothetical protein [Clostridium sardiniense]MBY0756479.1 hypothetical protein [Clostridium sardiniense]MDQ0460220.1 hypothetical protein [Clostridium sardiniense]